MGPIVISAIKTPIAVVGLLVNVIICMLVLIKSFLDFPQLLDNGEWHHIQERSNVHKGLTNRFSINHCLHIQWFQMTCLLCWRLVQLSDPFLSIRKSAKLAYSPSSAKTSPYNVFVSWSWLANATRRMPTTTIGIRVSSSNKPCISKSSSSKKGLIEPSDSTGSFPSLISLEKESIQGEEAILVLSIFWLSPNILITPFIFWMDLFSMLTPLLAPSQMPNIYWLTISYIVKKPLLLFDGQPGPPSSGIIDVLLILDGDLKGGNTFPCINFGYLSFAYVPSGSWLACSLGGLSCLNSRLSSLILTIVSTIVPSLLYLLGQTWASIASDVAPQHYTFACPPI